MTDYPTPGPNVLIIDDDDEEQSSLLEGLRAGGLFVLSFSLKDQTTEEETSFCGAMRVELVSEDDDLIETRITCDIYAGEASIPEGNQIPILSRNRYREFWSLLPFHPSHAQLPELRFEISEGRQRLRIPFLTSQLSTLDSDNDSLRWCDGDLVEMLLHRIDNRDQVEFGLTIRDDNRSGHGRAIYQGREVRSLTICPAHVEGIPRPQTDGNAVSWIRLFRDVDWRIDVRPSVKIAHPNGQASWTLAELNHALESIAKEQDLDQRWSTCLLCVEEITALEEKSLRGVMFDFGTPEANKVPRQGSAIAAGWKVPQKDVWKPNGRTRFSQFHSLYFRTAAHEIGHSLSMGHSSSSSDEHIMTTTDLLVGGRRFPDQIVAKFSDDESVWLRHHPDPVVRPGGIPYPADLDVTDFSVNAVGAASTLQLDVSPIQDSFPLGAPVRLNLKIANRGRSSARIPHMLGFSGGELSVLVMRPDGTSQTVFSSVLRCADSDWITLKSESEAFACVTLFRHRFTPLFAARGEYVIRAKIPFRRGRTTHFLLGECSVRIVNVDNKETRKLALRALKSSELQRLLVIGGDLNRWTSRLIKSILADPVLGPHFRFVEAKRVGCRHFERKANLRKMSTVLSSAVVTHQEVRRSINMIDQALTEGSRAYQSIFAMISVLRSKVKAGHVPGLVRSNMRAKLSELKKTVQQLSR